MLESHIVVTPPADFHPSVLEDDKTDKGYPAVEGRFWRQGQPDIQQSRIRDEVVHRHTVIVDRRLVGDVDLTSSKVTIQNFSQWKTRFPEAWDEFVKRDKAVSKGTPIRDVLEDLSPEFEESLFIAGIKTSEDLMEAPDALCEEVGLGTKRLRNDLIEAMQPKTKSKRKKG